MMKETIFNCDLKKKMELYAKGDKDAKNLIQNILYFREGDYGNFTSFDDCLVAYEMSSKLHSALEQADVSEAFKIRFREVLTISDSYVKRAFIANAA